MSNLECYLQDKCVDYIVHCDECGQEIMKCYNPLCNQTRTVPKCFHGEDD